jgi:predicted nucleotidyltransferase
MILNNHDKEIICKELEFTGIRSVILIGSRARCEGGENSDYDLYVVVSALLVPFIYGKLKKKEAILKNLLASNVSLSPMTLERIESGKDLLLLKTKNEGITLCGRDYLSEISISNISEISFDEIYSYLFSAIFFLIEHFNPEGNFNERCIYNTAKAIIYGAEIQLMITGNLESRRDRIIYEMNRLGLTKNIDIIMISKYILESKLEGTIEPLNFWLSGRDYLITVLIELNKKYFDLEIETPIVMQIEHIKELNLSMLKNFQFFSLSTLNKNMHLFNLLKNKNIEKLLWYSSLCLAISIERDLTFDRRYLINSYETLRDLEMVHENISTNNYSCWIILRKQIMKYWSIANAKRLI